MVQYASSESKEPFTKSHRMLCSNKKKKSSLSHTQHPHSLSLEMLPPDLTLVVKPFHSHQKLLGSFVWEKELKFYLKSKCNMCCLANQKLHF